MSTQAEAEAQRQAIDPRQVSDYLREHPEFFNEHPELLAELRIPHRVHGAVSLLERQLQMLRDSNRELKRKLMELVQVARENDRLHDRMHHLIMDLVSAESLQQLIDTLQDHLQGEFKADTVTLKIYGLGEDEARETGAQRLDRNDPGLEEFTAFLKSGRPLCGRLKQGQLDFLFGDQAPAVESAALIPIGKRGEHGMLAIGSRTANHFHPGMGTLFLSHMGELLAVFLRPHLPEPEHA